MIPDRIARLPCWQGAIAAQPMSGGLSNEIWKVTDAAGAHVVRLGQDYPAHHVFRDREAMVAGARVEETEDGLIIDGSGGEPLEGTTGPVATHLDHRIAMSMAVAGLSSSTVAESLTAAARSSTQVTVTETVAAEPPGVSVYVKVSSVVPGGALQ